MLILSGKKTGLFTMWKSKLGSLACATAVALLGTVAVNSGKAAAQNLVTNGSFETGDFTGWTRSGTNNADEVENSGAYGYNAEDGNDYADLWNGITISSYLSQTISTNISDSYQLTYYLASDGGTPSGFETIVGGTTLSDLTNIAAQPYTEYTFDFTATSTTTEIDFGSYYASSTSINGLALDNVSVVDTGATSSVPEPLTTGGTLVAVGMGWWMRRKRGSVSKGN